jgi:uncharacterized membrane protein YqiK
MQIIGDRKVRLIPDVLVGGSNGSSNGLVDGLLSMILWNQTGHLPTNGKQNGLSELSPLTEPVTASEGRMRDAHATQTQDGYSPVVVDFPLDKDIS